MAEPFQPKFVDLVRNYTNTTGTGNITLGQPVAGHDSMGQAVAVGARFFYCITGIDKPAEREVGRGTMMVNGTIAREPIGGPLTNFTGGSKTIALVVGADWFTKIGQWVNGGAETLAGLATTDKSSLVGAVNELAAGGGSGSAASLTFMGCAGATIPAGAKLVETIGYWNAGSGAARYMFDAAVNAAFVSANPRTAFLAADGRGFRLDHEQPLTLEMFGAKADYLSNANRGTDNHPAIMAALQFRPIAGRNYSPQVTAGLGSYFCGQTLEPRSVFSLRSARAKVFNNAASAGIAPSRIITPTNTICLIVASGSTSGATGTVAEAVSASQSFVSGITFEQTTQGSDLNAHAVLCRGAATIENCTYINIAGDGERFEAWTDGGGPLGNCNEWRSINNFAHSVGGNGHAAIGSDANGGYCIGFATQTCGLAGIYDRAYFVNSYVGAQITGYGTGGVQFAGRAWQPIAPAAALLGTTTPGTNANVWYDRGPLAAPTTAFPLWVSGNAYRPVGPVICGGPATFVGTYIEGNNEYGYAHAPGATVIGLDMGWTYQTPVCQAHGDLGFISKRGIGHLRGTEGKGANHPAFAAIGESEYTVLGGVDPSRPGEPFRRALIMSHSVAGSGFQFGYQTFQGFDTKDMHFVAAGRPAFSITAKGTARTFGRPTSAEAEGYFTLHDFGLVNSNDGGEARVMGLGAINASAYYAAGDYRFEFNPSTYRARAMMVCVGSGVGPASTWKTVASIANRGTTANRPGGVDARDAGVMYFDTTLAAAGKPVWWTGTAWVDANGAAA